MLTSKVSFGDIVANINKLPTLDALKVTQYIVLFMLCIDIAKSKQKFYFYYAIYYTHVPPLISNAFCDCSFIM